LEEQLRRKAEQLKNRYMAANKNKPVFASKKATGRVGGTNAPVYAVKNPTGNKKISQGNNIPRRGQGRK